MCVAITLQPPYRMFVEEGPGWDDDEECQCRACKADVHSELDVLQKKSSDEREQLQYGQVVSIGSVRYA